MNDNVVSGSGPRVACRPGTAPVRPVSIVAVAIGAALAAALSASPGMAQRVAAPANPDTPLFRTIQKGFQVTGRVTPRVYQLPGVADRREWQIRLTLANRTGYDIEFGQDLVLVESDSTADTFQGVYHARGRAPLKTEKSAPGEHPWASRYGLDNFDLQWADGSQTGYCQGGTHMFRSTTDDSRQTRPDMLTFGAMAAGATRALNLDLYQGRWLTFEHAASLRVALPELLVRAPEAAGRFRVVASFARPAYGREPWELARLEVVPIEIRALLRTLTTPEANVVTRIFAANWAVAADPMQAAAGVARVARSLRSGILMASCLDLLLGIDGHADPDLVSHVRSVVADPSTPDGIRQLGTRYLVHAKAEIPAAIAAAAPSRQTAATSGAAATVRDPAPAAAPTAAAVAFRESAAAPPSLPASSPRAAAAPASPTGDSSRADRKRELQDMYLAYLRAEGYVPEIDKDGDVRFKREGFIYYILVDERDPGYFRIILPALWTAATPAERGTLLAAVERAGRETKVVKAYIQKDRAELSFEQFVTRPEDFKGTFPRAMRALDLARAVVVEDMQKPAP